MAMRIPALVLVSVLALSMLLATLSPATALTILRDPDIEHSLQRLARPILEKAGLPTSGVKILVVRDSKLNAFVADTKHIFLHSGLILKLQTAEELQAVIAHEAAHIANGHITRRLANRRAAEGIARLGLVFALGIGAATKEPGAAAGIAIGTANSANRVFLGHTRAEESSADQAALRYMAQAGVDPQAMSTVLGYFRGQEVLSPGRQDPYVRSHPLTRDRIRAVAGYAAAYKNRAKDDPQADYWFLRAKGKLGAFLQSPGFTLRKVKKSDTSDIAALRRAVAYHRGLKTKKALAEMGRLLKARPNDPYLYELYGQILLESRNYAAAVNAYGRAVNLQSRNGLILAGYGRALLALKTRDGNAKALKALISARSRDKANPQLLRDLAVAYARAGQNGMASATTAERYALIGDFKTAATHAKRAVGLLPQGSPGWNRAQDVLHAAKSAG